MAKHCARSHPDIQFCDSNFDAGIGEALDVRLKILWELARNEVAFEPDAIDEVLLLQGLNQREHRIGLVVDTFDIEIVLPRIFG